MADILGLWKFPNHGKNNATKGGWKDTLEINRGDFWEWVTLFPTDGIGAEIAILQAGEFEWKIGVIINDIVSGWIQDYISHKAETSTLEDEWIDYEVRKLMHETAKLTNEMLLKAYAIEDSFEYMENNIDLSDEDLWEDFIFKMIGSILESYRNDVFALLVKNEEKLKNKKSKNK